MESKRKSLCRAVGVRRRLEAKGRGPGSQGDCARVATPPPLSSSRAATEALPRPVGLRDTERNAKCKLFSSSLSLLVAQSPTPKRCSQFSMVVRTQTLCSDGPDSESWLLGPMACVTASESLS